MVREEFGNVQTLGKNVHTETPPLAIPIQISVLSKILVLLLLKSTGKLLWTPAGMEPLLVGVTVLCRWKCRDFAPASSCLLWQAKLTPICGTGVLMDFQSSARAHHGGTAVGKAVPTGEPP